MHKQLKIYLMLLLAISCSPGLWAGSGRGDKTVIYGSTQHEDIDRGSRHETRNTTQNVDYLDYYSDVQDPNCGGAGYRGRFLADHFNWGAWVNDFRGVAHANERGGLVIGDNRLTLNVGESLGPRYRGQNDTYTWGVGTGYKNTVDRETRGCYGGVGGDPDYSDATLKNTGIEVFRTNNEFVRSWHEGREDVSRDVNTRLYDLKTLANGDVVKIEHRYTKETREFWDVLITENRTTNYRVIGSATNHTPIILDLAGTGKPDVSRHDYLPHAPAFYTDRVTLFDMTGSGVPILTEWVGSQAGLLCVPNEKGEITSALQLFGDAGGWHDGYEKLAALYDKNHDSVISGDELKGLAVWIDKNGNAKVDAGEIVSLDSLGITAISVKHKNYESWYQTKDGKTHKMWDWWPSGYSLKKIGSETVSPNK